MSCELRPGISKPIDALIRYFLEVKPYHTKLLEVVEKYRINEYISVEMSEDYDIDIIKKNLALCGPVGFGLIWDEECGFDAVECCDLFECIGGYGLIFDNSDLLVSAPIISIDEDADTVELAGEYTSSDFTYDQRIQIHNITASDTIVLRGNHESTFNTHKLFLVVPYFTFDIVDNTSNSFFVSGNKVSEIKSKMDFRVSGSRYNNGVYAVTIVRYIPATNRTEIVVSETVDTTIVSGYMEVKSPNKNNGVYQVRSVTYNGTNTIITIRNNNVFNHTTESVHGSIQLRTGLTAPRRVWHYNPDTLDVTEYKISHHSYNPETDTTTLTFAESISAPVSGNGEIRLYGYRFGAGFDGFEECTIPKPFNIHTNFGEVLNITVNTIAVSPTPTPSITPTMSITPTVTPSITVSPSISVTPTVTPTMSVTPTVTPTASPIIPLSLYSFGDNFFGETGLGTDTGYTLSPALVDGSGNWTAITCGDIHGLAIKDGDLYGWGASEVQQYYGVSYPPQYNTTPVLIDNTQTWSKVAAGYYHSLMITNTGDLYAVGTNGNGQVGNGTLIDQPTIQFISGGWSDCGAGTSSIGIKTNGTIWSWGSNFGGVTGQGTTVGNTLIPTQIGTDTDWFYLNVGDAHSLAIKDDGTLWAWGTNANGATGLGTDVGETLSPTQVGVDTWISVSAGSYCSAGVKTDGTLWYWGADVNGGSDILSPTQIGVATNWTKVAVGYKTLLAINSSGQLYSYGDNSNGSTGQGTLVGVTDPIAQIGSDSDWVDCESAVALFSIALKQS